MTDADAILVRVLAGSDALNLPIRNWYDLTAANRYALAKEFHAFGVPYRANADCDATRKAGERELDALHKAGLAVVRRRARVKYPGVRLTDRGDARARALCGLPDRAIGRLFLVVCAEWGKEYAASIGGERWVPEPRFNNGRGWGDGFGKELATVELKYLPAAREGWVWRCSSIHGNTCYSATTAGHIELALPSPVPDFGELPKHDPDATGLYRHEQDATLRALANETKIKPQELGELPAIHCLMGAKK